MLSQFEKVQIFHARGGINAHADSQAGLAASMTPSEDWINTITVGERRVMQPLSQAPQVKPIFIILRVQESEAEKSKDDWLSLTIQALKKASPTSLKISLRSIREGRLQGVGQCLVREYRMGCRALLLDKDKNPKWEPSRLDLITDSMVDSYFSKVDDDNWRDLKLPAQSNLPVHAIAKL
ncbi:hypothetical protein RJ640_002417 [Escallonia rubra]|uniref:3-hydroxyisobutyryl-CoA hydrolase n=1 Tax=Escallonia rubra TaxID=112253 RepID=A0AA88RM63_9ASTE|nr:hypothetical protein RJ640_002417 [Escallonia rubra]